MSFYRISEAKWIKFSYIYDDQDYYYFMNSKTFEQINLKKVIIGEKGRMLSENLEVTITFHNEKPILVELPNQINIEVMETDGVIKGQTVSSSYKPAILTNGIKIQVPPFINTGDIITIDTRTIEYIKKV